MYVCPVAYSTSLRPCRSPVPPCSLTRVRRQQLRRMRLRWRRVSCCPPGKEVECCHSFTQASNQLRTRSTLLTRAQMLRGLVSLLYFLARRMVHSPHLHDAAETSATQVRISGASGSPLVLTHSRVPFVHSVVPLCWRLRQLLRMRL